MAPVNKDRKDYNKKGKMDYIVAALLAPVPVFHLWLHALLPFWRKRPIFFYFWAALLWIVSYYGFRYVAAFSTLDFNSSGSVQLLGLLSIVFGTAAIALSARAIGIKRFAVWAVLKPESVSRRRITGGAFEWFPHPAYLGHIIIMLGCLLATGKFYISLVIAFQLAIMPIVIWLEEEELRKRTDE